MDEQGGFIDAPAINQFTVGRTFTIGHVAAIRQWLRENGLENVLHIERINDRNTVFLTIMLTSGPIDIEAAWLNSVHRTIRTRSALIAMLMEKAKEFVQVA